MTNETMKALLMIAMFGTLEFALYYSRIREATVLATNRASSNLTNTKVSPRSAHVLVNFFQGII